MALSKKKLGQLLKQARNFKSDIIGKHYTQRMLADDINRSQSYIGDIESGRTYPSFSTLNDIAEACGVPVSYFQDYDDINYNIDTFIKSQLNILSETELSAIREAIKNDPNIKLPHILDCSKTLSTNLFKTTKENVQFLLSQPSIINFCEVDITDLSEDEASEFVDEILRQVKLVSYKYKK
ncbi:helix-turn-helix domain-containing protein [Clostridium botulinum]|uniref:helix-turn-helix domain-containing protein n=1 Tax=Clostridium botulinum TaxID=1491 RepID=UPI0004D82708|nr:helix-turn-helix transcriptional regulator [Clostridium botulinum]KEI00090.1 DNA-binding protein [Clostridium botulinum C/D str. BKT75002]KEI05941.1 DNA-binding protein [Clostridium botulinum C/D str. BKT2873]MCD3351848.1 helix-turn-helix transcriptional regulator [Clostridium botulinum D/C]MCD3360813.1 helix-turn-helix transcriptional regulator [Clostridium botulinum D/C]MCD3362600.1 helix-turn-helix transcriptional regulator [Clostridium botulinum D/C]